MGADSGTLCVDKKCMCGTIDACTDPKAPTCDFANSQCMCGTGPGCADMTNADTCDKDNNKCKCGENDPCGKDSEKPICKNRRLKYRRRQFSFIQNQSISLN